ncbi:MAG: class I SAM-dependent methyltransferase [Pirellulales bacterium]
MLKRWVRWLEVLRAEKVCRILSPFVSGRSLDVGCWNGEVASRLTHADVVGIDVTIPPGPLVDVQVFDGTHIPFDSDSFDTVICCTVLHHAKHPEELLREMKRVGKKIVVFEDNVDHWWSHASTLGLHVVTSRLHDMPYERAGFHTTEEWIELFRKMGFRVTTTEFHKGTQPPWPLLRHTLFVLESEES